MSNLNLRWFMREMSKKIAKPPKKTLDDLMRDKSVVMGAEIVRKNQEIEIQKNNLRNQLSLSKRIGG